MVSPKETRTNFLKDLDQVNNQESLEQIRVKYLGRKGLINQAFQSLNKDNIKEESKDLNILKIEIENILLEKEKNLSQIEVLPLDNPTLPGIRQKIGHLHPTTKIIRSMNDFFKRQGFSVYEGPEIENDEYCFDKLNLPKDHPARELTDTLYITEPELLLRCHTSSVETRCMTNEKLPIRIVVPGKVYRNENSNATNNAMFYQYEGLVIDKGISMANLKSTLIEFVKFLYGPETITRFRCKYYPQVEPGAGLDIQCQFCFGKGCSVCKYRGFIEALGSGMVHPNVLKKCGIDPKVYTGFAFGMGLDRLVMLKYKIDDIRKLYNGELVTKENL